MARRRTIVYRDPELADLLRDDPALLAIADAIAETAEEGRPRANRPRLVAAAAVVVALALGLPAVAAFTPLLDFSQAPRAEGPVVRRFQELDRQAPQEMEPGVIADEARRLEIQTTGEAPVVVLVAPARRGGFCYEILGWAAGCDRDRSAPVSVGYAAPDGDAGKAIVFGWILDDDAATATVSSASETTERVSLVRISQPIDAAIFVASLAEHEVRFPVSVRVATASGETIATRVIDGPPR